ncbi:MAG: hypothetical protein KJ677_06530, partial [Gammaproteobacteria bacterium]|nr:hypothetical protein [Gammaproteobacteria bacterium]MBV1733859.1 hypothetical protein [Hydrogenophaga sp.]
MLIELVHGQNANQDCRMGGFSAISLLCCRFSLPRHAGKLLKPVGEPVFAPFSAPQETTMKNTALTQFRDTGTLYLSAPEATELV